MRAFNILLKLIRTGKVNFPHLKQGDYVTLKESAMKHEHLRKGLGSKRHLVTSIKWVKNLSYCDQFIKIAGSGEYYNVIFNRA